MPFTFSHPAAVLPFTYFPKRWFSLTGLIVGSMAPDFEYFLRMNGYSHYSHTWLGLFWFDVPITIIIAFTFHLLIRDPLIDNLPLFLKKHFIVFEKFDWTKYFKKNFLAVISSTMIGTATHIIWDGFTHRQGLFVRHFHELKNTISIAGFNIPVYNFLQHLSTVVGGLIMLYAVLQLPKQNIQPGSKKILPFWTSITVITIIVFAIRSIAGFGNDPIGNSIVSLISAGFIGLILTILFFPKKKDKNTNALLS